jgi:amino acid adenylation domain-containing protein
LNDASKTATAFIENAECLSGRRLYKTGDLVRHNADGTLVYIGRKDTQIKIHGQRVELGDIEHAMSLELPASTQVTAEFVRLHGEQNRSLTAFLELEPEEAVHRASSADSTNPNLLDITETMKVLFEKMNSALVTSLPGFMIPSLYIPVRKMPLSSSGKLDRGRLRTMASTLSAEQILYYSLASHRKRTPESQMEKLMHEFCVDVLEKSPDLIGADDNFFRIGGDSITAIRLSAAARAHGISLTVANIFQKPVLSEMAATVSELKAANTITPALVPPFSLTGAMLETDALTKRAAMQCGVDQSLVEDIYPCTPLQQGLMALSMRHAGAYVGQHVLRLPASLDLGRFKAAWTFAFESNAILRTRIISDESGGLLQVVVKQDLEWEHAHDLDEYLRKDYETPVEFGGSMTRFALAINEAGDRYFIWTAHHATYDAWSLSLMWRIVERIYLGEPVTRSVSYNTFIKVLGDIDFDAAAGFWTKYLSQAEAVQFPKLPSPSYVAQVSQSRAYRARIPSRVDSDITLPTILRAAWALTISQYSNNNDVVFGNTVSGRNAAVSGITEIVGPTIVTVPVRATIQSTQTIEAFLHGIQDQATEMIPFEHFGLQRINQLGEDMKQICNFQNFFVIQLSDAEIDLEKTLGVELIKLPEKNFNTYPLVVECLAGGEDLDISANFDPEIIQDELVEKMLYQFEHLLNQLSSGSMDKELRDIKVLNRHDEETIRSLNRAMPEKVESCIHELIHHKALITPDAPAICAWDANWTYADLDALSSKLAQSLIRLGFHSALIPLCFEKSAWTIVAMLAVLKIGSTFVPLDPSYPVHRLKEIIRQTGANFCLSSRKHEKLLSNLVENVIVVDSSLEKNSHASYCNVSQDPSQAAYIIFTSGSTGIPKGVIVEHQAFCTSATVFNERIGINSLSRVLQFTSYSFDVSLAEILGTLLAGGCVCVPIETDRENDLTRAINTLQTNVAYLTPSVATLLSPRSLPSLETLVLASEPMTAAHIRTWTSSVRLINAYGPTECSVLSLINPEVTSTSSPLNIGRASDSVCWIADAQNHNQLAPFGCIGELLIEEPILA